MARKSAFACLLVLFSWRICPAQTGSNGPAQPNQSNAPAQAAPAPPAGGDSADDDLPEEDESLKPRIYPFNPLEAERNIKVGNFYMHQATSRGYRAAAGRYEDATKYNPSSAEAFFRLGEAQQKLKHMDKAKEAFEKAMKLEPDSKFAKDAKKHLASLS